MKILQEFILVINFDNLPELAQDRILHIIPIRNITIIFDNINNFEKVLKLLNKFRKTVEKLELRNLNTKHFYDFKNILSSLPKINSLILDNCSIENLNNETIENYSTLRSVTLKKCNENIFVILRNQESLEKIIIVSHESKWKGFYHEGLNEILIKSKNLKHVVLDGIGTGSYFDLENFPFKIHKLETTMISYNWYVGLKNSRTEFLKSQKGSLKELVIHQLPLDFDGGDVLKYIIEEMNLDKFYYGKIELILNGKKQNILEISANEINITSICEFFRQYPSNYLF